jgi:ABC-2 type transport system ATP-binding protein
MFMRLGFSVAIHVDPDVLLVDEVLAVGDIGFQLRCLDRMRALQRSGATVLFVSLSTHAVHLLCPRAIVVHGGRIVYDGSTESAIGRYHELLATDDPGDASARVRVVRRELLADGERVESVDQDRLLTYRTVLRFERAVEGPQVCFRVVAEDGTLAYSMQTAVGERWRSYGPGDEATVEVAFRPRFGRGGTFRIGMFVTDADAAAVLANDQAGPSFYVPPRLGVAGVADLGATITIDGEERTNHRSLRLGGPSAAPQPAEQGAP